MSFWSDFFSPTKTISVSSTVYNLAGDVNKRPNFLDTTTLGAVLSDSDQSITEQLQNAYINGPGIQLRGFSRWARDFGYDDLVGISTTPLSLTSALDPTVLKPLLPPPPAGQSLVIQASSIGQFDFTFWVNEFMVENYPTLLNTAYTCDLNGSTGVVTITFADTTTTTFTLPPFDATAQYLYVAYNYGIPGTPGSPEIPATVGPPPTPDIPAVPYVPDTWTQVLFLAYKQGSGNPAFDALFTATSDTGLFFPYIPIMVDKNFISASYMPDVYTQAKKAVTKSLNAKYDDIVTKIKANANVGDIDYAYIVFGVSLNVAENACRNYIYQFFLDIMQGLNLSNSEFQDWQAAYAVAAASMATWAEWQVAQSDSTNPLYGTASPTVVPYPAAPSYSVQVASTNDAILNYNMTISWAGLNETTGSGQLMNELGVPAKAGEFWFENTSNTFVSAPAWVNAAIGSLPTTQEQTHTRLYWQVDSNSWRALDIYNLTHTNAIYGGKTVVTTAIAALSDSSESPFIIPLNEEIYASMSLITSTQMATACCFLVFNSYTVVTAPWYTAGWFKVLLIVVVIALSVATGGLGIGAGGLLGTNLSVGMSLGLSGTAAAIVGAVANALAAIVLVQLIQVGSTDLFGPQLGAIIGAIAGIVALQVGTALAMGTTPSALLGQMLQPTNLLKLTESAGNGFAQVLQGDAQKIQASTQTMEAQYNAADAQVEAQYTAMFGAGGGADLAINPLSLTDVNLPNVPNSTIVAEAPSNFLNRTLMTGSDVCNLSMSYISNFCDANLSTTLPNMT